MDQLNTTASLRKQQEASRRIVALSDVNFVFAAVLMALLCPRTIFSSLLLMVRLDQHELPQDCTAAFPPPTRTQTEQSCLCSRGIAAPLFDDGRQIHGKYFVEAKFTTRAG